MTQAVVAAALGLGEPRGGTDPGDRHRSSLIIRYSCHRCVLSHTLGPTLWLALWTQQEPDGDGICHLEHPVKMENR